jgi:hypothetical protein
MQKQVGKSALKKDAAVESDDGNSQGTDCR